MKGVTARSQKQLNIELSKWGINGRYIVRANIACWERFVDVYGCAGNKETWCS